jgi:hypothetical protein
MKALAALSLVCSLSLPALAQSDTTHTISRGDTSRIRIGDTKFLIINEKAAKADTSHVREGFTIGKDKKKDNDSENDHVHWQGVEIGFNGLMTSFGSEALSPGYEFLDVNTSRIATLNLNLFEKGLPLYKKYVTLVTGLGLEWNNYYFRKNFTLVPGVDSVVGVYNSTDYIKNKLTTNFINVPLLLEFNTSDNPSKSLHLAAGLVGGYLYRAHTKQKFEEGGETHRRKQSDSFNLSSFRYSATVRLGYGKFNIFANYALSEMFREGSGPEIHPYSVGISLNGF